MLVSSHLKKVESNFKNGGIEPHFSPICAPWTVHDRVQEFVIKFRTLCWRPLEEKRSYWSATALPDGAVPLQIRADDEDLMVLDTEGVVHYAKSCQKGASLMHRISWKKGIFGSPTTSKIFNQFICENPNDEAPKGGIWSCSYMEAGSFYLDAFKKEHPLGDGEKEIAPATTAFVADKEGRVFRFYDPYIFKGPEDAEKLFLPFPETSEYYFELKGMASCRSGIFCIGYDVLRAEEKGVKKRLSAYFISADANLLGLNPFITYLYSFEKEGFALPASLYKRIDLPKDVTSLVGVERGGKKGMRDLVLTIEGRKLVKDAFGVQGFTCGYYQKGLNDSEWKFVAVGRWRVNKKNLLKEHFVEPNQAFSPKVFDYKGVVSGSGKSACLRNFGKHSLQSTIEIAIDGKTVELSLFPKESVWNILGFEQIDFTIVVPKQFLEVIGWRKEVIPVSVVIEGENLCIFQKEEKTKLLEFGVSLEETNYSDQNPLKILDFEKGNC